MSRRIGLARALATAAAATTAGVVLALAGGPPPPRGLSASELAGWVEHHGVTEALAAAARLLGLVLAAWISACSATAAAGWALGQIRIAGLAARAAPPGLRRLLAAGTLSAHLAMIATPAAGDPAPPTVSELRAGPEAAEAPELIRALRPADPAEALVVNLDPQPGEEPAVLDRWELRPGDHLWHVASEVLAAGGAEPSPEEIADYHRRLVEANEDRLAVPGDPDLVYPGQVIVLPDPLRD